MAYQRDLEKNAKYLKSKNASTRWRAASEFGLAAFNGQDIKKYLPLLFTALDDPNPIVRRCAVGSLGDAARKNYSISAAFPRQRCWVRDNAAKRRLLNRLENATLTWNRAQIASGSLWTGPAYAQEKVFLSSTKPRLIPIFFKN